MTRPAVRCGYVPKTVVAEGMRLLRPIILQLVKWRINPNFITGLGLCLNIGAAYLAYHEHFLISGVLLGIGGLCDWADGEVARTSLRCTPKGAALEATADRLSEMAFLTALAFVFEIHGSRLLAALSIIALIGSVLTSYARAIAQAEGIHAANCILQRQDRVMILVSGLLLTSVNSLTSVVPRVLPGMGEQMFAVTHWPLTLTIAVLALLTCYSTAQRVYHIWTEPNPSASFLLTQRASVCEARPESEKTEIDNSDNRKLVA